ncbi:hypothetical protein WN867_04145 [Tetragenococcus halophilus]|uniref:hypothetical protein n=1 Tax=Tetragenococcus halophilus TaxID=51669 RepID=UPI0020965822|nr:hypothetical protein [Tetragenococcus halophilus]MCO7026824.1 hypothetical protein [Tetragenococcus halophilus]
MKEENVKLRRNEKFLKEMVMDNDFILVETNDDEIELIHKEYGTVVKNGLPIE